MVRLGPLRLGERDRDRVSVAAGLAALLSMYGAVADRLPNLPIAADTALTACLTMPAAFALVWLAVPLRRWRGLFPVALALAALGAVWYASDLDVAANLAKLAAAALGGFWFLTLFERVSWVVLVACVVPVVDALSVWRGPTNEIVGDRPEVFGALSVAFPSPGRGSFQLGLPDVIFFALFLAAAFRWRLRPGWTWLAMTGALGLTIALAVTTDPFGIGGLPALPAVSLAFLAANADLLWRGTRRPAGGLAGPVPVELESDDPATLARFYREGLGIGAEQVRDAQVLLYADWLSAGADRAEVGIATEDVDQLFTRAVEHGARPLVAPRDSRWGRTATVGDPAGTRVVLRDVLR